MGLLCRRSGLGQWVYCVDPQDWGSGSTVLGVCPQHRGDCEGTGAATGQTLPIKGSSGHSIDRRQYFLKGGLGKCSSFVSPNLIHEDYCLTWVKLSSPIRSGFGSEKSQRFGYFGSFVFGWYKIKILTALQQMKQHLSKTQGYSRLEPISYRYRPIDTDARVVTDSLFFLLCFK